MKIKDIKKILRMSKKEMIENTVLHLSNAGYSEIISTKDYTYAKGEIPILLVAHCDTVHKNKPTTILYDSMQEMMWSPQGIGGDDRCGIIAIYEIIKQYKPYVLFTQDEEIGGLGAKVFCEKENLDKIKFAIEIDRRGNNQAVFYDCGNKELQEYICEEKGFDLEYGSFTDVCFIGEMFNIGIVNLSAGYYNEHQNIEFIHFPALYNTIKKVKEILKENIDKYFDYQEECKYYNTTYNYNKFIYQEEKDFEDLDEEEWEKLYGYTKPKTKAELYKIILYDYFEY